MDKELTIRERAMEWFSDLDAKFASMSDDEQWIWLSTTQDGLCYTDIMSGKCWGEDWEDITVVVYRERFGA